MKIFINKTTSNITENSTAFMEILKIIGGITIKDMARKYRIVVDIEEIDKE